MSKALSANIHDPNHTVDEYDIYFNGEPIETGGGGGDEEITDQLFGGRGTPINDGNTLRVQLSQPLNDIEADVDIIAFSIKYSNVPSDPKIVAIYSKIAYIFDQSRGLYAGQGLTFTIVDSRTIDIGKGNNTVHFTEAMDLNLVITTFN